MIHERKLLYLKDAYRTPDGQPQHKYCLVLKANGTDIFLVNLPSSQIRFPFPNKNTHAGCIEIPDAGMNIYCFLKDVECTDSKHTFKVDTFIYGNWVQDWDMHAYLERCAYTNSVVDCGFVDMETYKSILQCLLESGDTKRMYKPRIHSIIQALSTN